MNNEEDKLYYLARNMELHKIIEYQNDIIINIYKSLEDCIKNDFRLETLKRLRENSKDLLEYLNNVDNIKKL